MNLLTLSPPTDVRAWRKITGFTQAAAKRITGGLSSPGKMPSHAYGLPAAECNVGSKLRASSTKAKPTVCGSCYALKGFYTRYPEVIKAQYRRLAAIRDPRWVDAMVCLIGWTERETRFFRWHDAGDLQSLEHLSRIVEIAERLPWVTFWCPTRERAILLEWIKQNGPLPVNLTVRESAALVGHFPNPERAIGGRTFSAVAKKGQAIPADAHACPAYKQGGECRDCRACWSQEVSVVVYPLH